MRLIHQNFGTPKEQETRKKLCFSHHKDNKLPFYQKSAVPRNHKKNAIVGEIHRSNKISSDSEEETSIIKTKYLKAWLSQWIY